MPDRLLPRRRLIDRQQRQRHLDQLQPVPTPTHDHPRYPSTKNPPSDRQTTKRRGRGPDRCPPKSRTHEYMTRAGAHDQRRTAIERLRGGRACPAPQVRARVQRADMLTYMVRTTVKLPPDLDARLRHEAARRKITISELTREAIETHLSPRRRLGAAAAGRSGRSDVSERIKEILAREVSPSP